MAAGLIEPYTAENAAKIPAKYKDRTATGPASYVGALGYCSNQARLKDKGLGLPLILGRSAGPETEVAGLHRAPVDFELRSPTLWTQVARLGSRIRPSTVEEGCANVLQYTGRGRPRPDRRSAGRGDASLLVFDELCALQGTRHDRPGGVVPGGRHRLRDRWGGGHQGGQERRQRRLGT